MDSSSMSYKVLMENLIAPHELLAGVQWLEKLLSSIANNPASFTLEFTVPEDVGQWHKCHGNGHSSSEGHCLQTQKTSVKRWPFMLGINLSQKDLRHTRGSRSAKHSTLLATVPPPARAVGMQNIPETTNDKVAVIQYLITELKREAEGPPVADAEPSRTKRRKKGEKGEKGK